MTECHENFDAEELTYTSEILGGANRGSTKILSP